MSKIRKKAMLRLVLCAVALTACIIFSVLLRRGTFDGKTGGSSCPAGDVISADTSAISDPTADSFTPSTPQETPAEEAHPEATPEPTPDPTAAPP